MSMELLAEAASALLPNKVLIGMLDIQAHHWIRVDESAVELHIAARVVHGLPDRVEVQIWDVANYAENKAASKSPAVRGHILFGDKRQVPPQAQMFQLADERPSRLTGDLYDGRMMFHGPCFQGVASVDRSGSDGVIGYLKTLPTDTLFRLDKAPRFVTDPVALDAAGQLVGFWAAEALDRGFVVFPYRLDSLQIYASLHKPGERLACRVKVKLLGKERMRSELEVVRADGTVWMKIQGWEDRRFDPPPRFHQAWIAPEQAFISEPWTTPTARLADRNNYECYRLNALFEPGAALWKDLWASLVLSRQERKTLAERQSPEARTMEWLGGRTAAKDAVRSYLKRRHNLSVLPADIEIKNDEHGKPVASGTWTQRVGTPLELSITHSNGAALALVGQGSRLRGVGIDMQHQRDLEPGFADVAFTSDEQSVLEKMSGAERTEWMLRLWCAKEAVAKALGRGLLAGPSSVRITSVHIKTGMVQAIPAGQLAKALSRSGNIELTAHTAYEEGYFVATSIWEGRTMTHKDGQAELDEQTITEDVLTLLNNLARDWEYSEQITPDTLLFADLGFESIDAVVLASFVQDHYHCQMPFPQLLAEIGRRDTRDLSIGELVSFIHLHVNAAAGVSR